MAVPISGTGIRTDASNGTGIGACNDHSRPSSLSLLPDELITQIFCHLDVPDLLAASRVSHRVRDIALDPLLHIQRLRACPLTLSSLLLHRPPIRSLQPPVSSIYLTRTHVTARRLHFGLLSASLNRSLSRRPSLSSLVNANIVPKECCRRDRNSGEMVVAIGGLLERKKKVEKEKFKEGLRVWLERKAGEIRRRHSKNGTLGVGILVWRFSKRAKNLDAGVSTRMLSSPCDKPEHGRVRGLKRLYEELSTSSGSVQMSC